VIRRANRTVDLWIQNDLSEIGTIRDSLDKLASELGIPMRALTQLQVALDEVASNVVKYSWEDGGRHEFLVRITVHARGVDLEFFDDGREFDPLSAPPSNLPTNLQRPGPGGLGIHMVKKLVDTFSYERIDGRNHTKLTKKCDVGTVVRRSEE
jgi:anti-sigma regulatory factor (Ser/Thr protein kinase)